MKSFDRFAQSEMFYKSKAPMTNHYERLCEFCHPNLLGVSVGSELDFPKGFEIYEIEPIIRPAVHSLFSDYAYVAAYAFLHAIQQVLGSDA